MLYLSVDVRPDVSAEMGGNFSNDLFRDIFRKVSSYQDFSQPHRK